MSVKIEGMRELLSNLSSKESEILAAARKGNIAGADIIVEELKRNVPQSGYNGAKTQAKLVNAVTRSGNKTDKGTYEPYVEVGFNKSANFRAHFQEFGTISQGPQGYMSKTVQAVEGKVAREVEKAIKGAIG